MITQKELDKVLKEIQRKSQAEWAARQKFPDDSDEHKLRRMVMAKFLMREYQIADIVAGGVHEGK